VPAAVLVEDPGKVGLQRRPALSGVIGFVMPDTDVADAILAQPDIRPALGQDAAAAD